VIACGIVSTKAAAMSRIRVLICRMDDADANQMMELAAFDLPEADITALKPETALDGLETTTQETGNAMLGTCLLHADDLVFDQPGDRLLDRLKRGVAWLIAEQPRGFGNAAIRAVCNVVPGRRCLLRRDSGPPFLPG
jgi:hypothetical protein